MKAKIISAFPACGKTYIYNLRDVYRLKIIDSDFNEFSWIKDENGNNTKIRNPFSPQNYINHIKENMEIQDVIFISSHDIVRKALKENNIEYILVYPKRELKCEYIQRFINRGNNKEFIDFISNNWDKFIDEMNNEDFPNKYSLNKDEYIPILQILDNY